MKRIVLLLLSIALLLFLVIETEMLFLANAIEFSDSISDCQSVICDINIQQVFENSIQSKSSYQFSTSVFEHSIDCTSLLDKSVKLVINHQIYYCKYTI
jgi:hypothetical protein